MASYFPKVAIPLILLYLLLQVRQMRRATPTRFALMAALQLATLADFPYATLLLVLTTAITLLLRAHSGSVAWMRWVGFGAACGVIDVVFVSIRARVIAGAGGGAPDPSLLGYLLHGKVFWIMVLCGIVVACVPGRLPEVKWTVVAVAWGEALMMLGDAIAPMSLQISNHGYYFAQAVFGIALAYLFARGCEWAEERQPKLSPVVAVTALLACLLQGVVASRATAEPLAQFAHTAQTARAVSGVNLGQDSLVLAAADSVDDVSTWVPMLARTNVLYSRSAELLLDLQDRERLNRERRGMYLYFTGWDRDRLDRILSRREIANNSGVLDYLERPMIERVPDAGPELARIRGQIAAELRTLDEGDPSARDLFARYRTVVVIDSATRPAFSAARLEKYLQRERSLQSGDAVFTFYRPAAVAVP